MKSNKSLQFTAQSAGTLRGSLHANHRGSIINLRVVDQQINILSPDPEQQVRIIKENLVTLFEEAELGQVERNLLTSRQFLNP